MGREKRIRLALGILLALGGVSIVVGTMTGQDAYLSAAAAAVCLVSGAAMAYTRRIEDS